MCDVRDAGMNRFDRPHLQVRGTPHPSCDLVQSYICAFLAFAFRGLIFKKAVTLLPSGTSQGRRCNVSFISLFIYLDHPKA